LRYVQLFLTGEVVVDLPNIKSAKKRVAVTAAKTQSNRAAKSALRTTVKKAKLAAQADENLLTPDVFAAVQKDIDRGASRGLIHKNKAARMKSQLAKAAQ